MNRRGWRHSASNTTRSGVGSPVARILLTGAAGFIGSHLAEALVARGDEVVGVDNFDPFYPRAIKEANLSALRGERRFRLEERDVAVRGALDGLVTADTVVVHLAAKAGVRPSLADPAGYARVNVGGTAEVVAATRAAGAARVVFASSSSVYGDDTPPPFREDAPALHPVSPYAATKRAAELLLESLAPHAGLRAVALRYFTVYGPRQRPDLAIHAFTRALSAGEPVTLFGNGDATRDYTYCDDIVAGTMAAIDWTADAPVGLEIVNLGGHEVIALGDMLATVAGALGVDPKVRRAPPQAGDVRATSADLVKAARLLAYRPRVAFTEGIRRFVEWYRGSHDRQF
jgi:UDP-glucuronate 4-epimerase